MLAIVLRLVGLRIDHLVQSADNVSEPWSDIAVFLPTVQHQLVQGTGAVHGWRQAVVLFYGVDNLMKTQKGKVALNNTFC